MEHFCTSVLLDQQEAVRRYRANNSTIVDTLHMFKMEGVQHAFCVDATNLSGTATWSSKEPCNTVVWNYPFPESNAVDMSSKTSLIKDFFVSVAQWQAFSSIGTVVLGLKSCSFTSQHFTENADFQYHQWDVERIACECGFKHVSSVGPMPPFWHPTHVSGRPLCKRKDRDAGEVMVKFYAFQRLSSE